MRKSEVQIGDTYLVKVSGHIVPVTILRESQHGGWVGRNENTGREVRIRSAARLRRPHRGVEVGLLAAIARHQPRLDAVTGQVTGNEVHHLQVRIA